MFLGVNITKSSYALFSASIKGEKTIEVEVDTLINKTTVFNYTGDSQEYEVPKDGYYYLELGGAYYSGMGIIWNHKTSSNSFDIRGFTRAKDNYGEPSFGIFNYPTDILTLTYVNNKETSAIGAYTNGELKNRSTLYKDIYQYASTIGNIGINKNQIYSGSYTRSFANMNVYSVRIYEKALSEEEILHNYNYDKEKFNLE